MPLFRKNPKNKTPFCPFNLKCFCGVSAGLVRADFAGRLCQARSGQAGAGGPARSYPALTCLSRDLPASVQPSSCSYGKQRHGKATNTTKCPQLFWHSHARDAGYLHLGGEVILLQITLTTS